jgi:DNA polymerase alpha subunit A
VVRRDWCVLARQIGERVIGEILSGQNCDLVLANILKALNEVGEKVAASAYDLSMYEISKQLNRNPEDYSDANHQSHVLVALRHNKDPANSKKYRNGDVVSYIVCEDGSGGSATQRAYSKTELLKGGETLKLDTKYYLGQQVHPVVTRLCEPIDGIDSYQVAQALGLDPSGFKHKSAGGGANAVNIAPPQLTKQQKRLESFVNELEKYSNCVPFKYICPGCKTESVWQSPFVKQTGKVKPEPTAVTPSSSDTKMDEDDEHFDFDESSLVHISAAGKPKTTGSAGATTSAASGSFKCILDACSNPSCKIKPCTRLAYIKNSLTLQMNKFIRQYYQAWLVCEDPMCSFRTKRISCKFFHGKPQCIECEKYNAALEYSHADLFYQMRFFRFIFDTEGFKNYYKDDAGMALEIIKRFIK